MHCSDRFVFKIKMPSDIRVQLINDMADIEYVPISCSFIFDISVHNYKSRCRT